MHVNRSAVWCKTFLQAVLVPLSARDAQRLQHFLPQISDIYIDRLPPSCWSAAHTRHISYARRAACRLSSLRVKVVAAPAPVDTVFRDACAKMRAALLEVCSAGRGVVAVVSSDGRGDGRGRGEMDARAVQCGAVPGTAAGSLEHFAVLAAADARESSGASMW